MWRVVLPSKVSAMGLSALRTSLEIKHPDASAKRQTTLCIIDLILTGPNTGINCGLRWKPEPSLPRIIEIFWGGKFNRTRDRPTLSAILKDELVDW